MGVFVFLCILGGVLVDYTLVVCVYVCMSVFKRRKIYFVYMQ